MNFFVHQANRLSKKFNGKSQTESNKNEIEEGDSENVEKNSWSTSLLSWIDFFLPNQPASVNKGVGDSLICEPKSFLKNTFERKKENKCKKIVETEIPWSDSSIQNEFSRSFQTQANNIKKEIISSSLSSIIATSISHPFKVVIMNFQSVRYPKKHERFESFKNRHRSIRFVMEDIIKTKGLRRFYKGHFANQRDSLYHAISMFWTFYEVDKHLSKIEYLKDYPNVNVFAAGFLSATIPVLVLNPIANLQRRRQRLKKTLQKYGPLCRSSLKCKINFRPIFRGEYSLFLQKGTLYGLRFLLFNKICKDMKLTLSTHDKATSTNPNVSEVDTIVRLSNYQLLIAGGIAAVVGDLIVYPLDVVHTRITMSPLERQQFNFEHTCRRIGQCFMTIFKYESVLAFYSGLLPNVLKSTVHTAVQFAVYERAKHWLGPYLST